VKTRIFHETASVVALLLITLQPFLSAQDSLSLSLDNAIELALQKNHLLNIKKLQVEEKQQKVNEDKVKYLPSVIIGSSYQYNTNLPSLTLEQGRFGELPYGGVMIPLPAKDEVISMGNHNIYNAGVTLYQPVSQIGKINAGVMVSRTELQITMTEEAKSAALIRQSVEKLYYGLLIIQKQIEEAEIKTELAKSKLNDVENALLAGKTNESNKYGLAAAAADEEQNLLKLKIGYDDYASDLKQLTGIDPAKDLSLEPVSVENFVMPLTAADTSALSVSQKNNDLKIAVLSSTKADYSIRASRFSYLPDIGILGGYSYQHGTIIYPKNNTFIGASLKWNIQDLLSNRTVQRQRIYLKGQADENLANTREQVNKDIAKACRRIRQSEELIKVAAKALEYRREDLKIQGDRRNSGLNLESDLLTAKAAMAKAQSDYFAAQLNYRIAISDLQIFTGNY
jgi:outer membrane protein